MLTKIEVIQALQESRPQIVHLFDELAKSTPEGVFLHKFKKRPLHLFGSIGLLSFLVGLIINLVLAYQRIFADKFLSNRPLLFLAVMLVIVGIQFISIGLLNDVVIIVHTETTEEMRIISMRRANKNEQKLYFKNL